IASAASHHRSQAQQLLMEPVLGFYRFAGDRIPSGYLTHYTSLGHRLPDNVHLLTLEQWNHGQYLLRLEHFYQNQEDAKLSKPAIVPLKNLFVPFEVVSVEELALGANQPVSALTHRMKFDYRPMNGTSSPFQPPKTSPVDPKRLEVT